MNEPDDFKDVHNRDSGIVEPDVTNILDKPEVRVLSPGNRRCVLLPAYNSY